MSNPSIAPSPVVVLPVTRSSDWDGARTRRVALRVPQAEWCASVYSEAGPDGFWAPRCDYALEGLLALVGRENWRFLDRVAFQVLNDDTPLAVTPLEVRATPETATYVYRVAEDAELAVTYALVEAPPEGAAGLVVTYTLKGGGRSDWMLHLKPVLDIRRSDAPSDPARHRVNPVDAHHTTVVNANRWLVLQTDQPTTFVPGRDLRDLPYPLGQGDRHAIKGKTGEELRFKAAAYRVFSPGELRFSLEAGRVTLTLQPGEGEKALLKSVDALVQAAPDLIAAQQARYEGYAAKLPRLNAEAVARAYIMAEKFRLPVEGGELPELAAWWGRTTNLPALFDGYLHNWRTLKSLGKLDTLEAALALVLRYQEPGLGRLPKALPISAGDQDRFAKTGALPAEYYKGSAYATLLFTVADEVLADLTDEALVLALWTGFKQVFTGFKASRLSNRNGTPVLLENGLLLVAPFHSWIDGRRVVWAEGMTVTDLPIRCPATWQTQDVLHFRDSHYAWEQYQYPTYYLPEINAQWLRTLAFGIKLATRFEDSELAEELSQLEELAKDSYKAILWNSHANNLYNLVTLDRRIDGMPTATAVEAAALLGEPFFTRLELEQIWATARNRLLVKRQVEAPIGSQDEPLAFGLLTKDSPERIYKDAQQSHEAVIWPRETAYLIRLLRMLGQEATIRELLISNLAHQTNEGTLFYNHEVLSLPEGGNPEPVTETADNPVPVRNPMAFSSQWCDAYLG